MGVLETLPHLVLPPAVGPTTTLLVALAHEVPPSSVVSRSARRSVRRVTFGSGGDALCYPFGGDESLDDAVLEGVVAEDDEAAARPEQVHRGGERLG